MKQQSHIYIAFALFGVALFGYILDRSSAAWSQSGLSPVFVVMATLALIFGALAAFYAWLALLFAKRSVDSIAKVEGGLLLKPSGHCTFMPVLSPSVHLRRKLGEQFSGNESEPKFAIFTADGKHWVCTCSTYQVAISSDPPY